jgi:hypothetical protein
MKTFFVFLILLAIIGGATYGQAQDQAVSFAVTPFDRDQVLSRLAVLKPFQSGKGGGGSGYALSVTKEEFRKSLIFLPPEQTDAVMKDFGMAAAFSFKDDTQFLIITQWRDDESAKRFMGVEQESWRLKDKEYKQNIKDVTYTEIEIEKGEKASLTRRTLEQSGHKLDVTTFISARKNYFFECNLIGKYEDDEVKKFVSQIWKIVEAEVKKGTR